MSGRYSSQKSRKILRLEEHSQKYLHLRSYVLRNKIFLIKQTYGTSLLKKKTYDISLVVVCWLNCMFDLLCLF